MFVGRSSEINTLLNTYKTKNQHSIVYGNRRVGKTALVTETAKRSGLEFITYECLKSSLRNNLDVLSRQLYEEGLFSSPITFNTFIDLFKYINSLNKHLIVLIDEYPYLYYKNDNTLYLDLLKMKVLAYALKCAGQKGLYFHVSFLSYLSFPRCTYY